VTRFALDKRLTYQRAGELGVGAPWTMVAASGDEFATRKIPFPVILKPAVNHHFFPKTNVKALSAATLSELQRRHAQMSQFIPAEEILVQERIPGGGENQFSFCGLCRDGKVYAALVAQRRRQYPVEFGNASSFVETTNQPIVEADGRRFLESIGFDGMAEVEFKFDPRDGKYKILDVNPRAWGWHTLGRAAGVDFSYLLWLQKTGAPVTAPVQRRDASWFREITDPLSILKSPHRGAELGRLLRALFTGRLTLATFDLLDPVPFFAEFALWASQGIARQKKAKGVLTGEA
jgi:predicted ATP-grasp superfamily ATP-dependent carboligase